uniref:(California timema) hypothetical protein n=1 Tax=Timema californicum TaxID=61474 RepID=A0A7R9J4J3_TIMCA|nr:unnamed protein product [Timema californicum]
MTGNVVAVLLRPPPPPSFTTPPPPPPPETQVYTHPESQAYPHPESPEYPPPEASTYPASDSPEYPPPESSVYQSAESPECPPPPEEVPLPMSTSLRIQKRCMAGKYVRACRLTISYNRFWDDNPGSGGGRENSSVLERQSVEGSKREGLAVRRHGWPSVDALLGGEERKEEGGGGGGGKVLDEHASQRTKLTQKAGAYVNPAKTQA